jgi:hypothetical protein
MRLPYDIRHVPILVVSVLALVLGLSSVANADLSLTLTGGPGGTTNDSTPTFTFTTEDADEIECSIDQGVPSYGSCSDDDFHTTTLGDGAYTFRVRAIDRPRDTTVETRDFVVDTAPPNAVIVGGPLGLTNEPNASFAFGSDEAGATFECRVYGGPFTPCTSPQAYAGLPDGSYGFDVRATDAAGNTGVPATRPFSVDTTAPTLVITTGPLGTTRDVSPLFGFAVAGALVAECSIDQGDPSFVPCSHPASHVADQRLPDGTYTFRIRAVDASGNAAAAERLFSVATAPAALRLISPFPIVRLAGRVTGGGAEVRVLAVRAPRGSLVRVSIKPRCLGAERCVTRRSAKRVGRKGVVRLRALELAYPAGTVIEIRVSRAARIGKYTRFVVRRGKPPRRVDRCLMPGAARGSRCPTA